jgi:molybdopterin-containing oxidoreductase family iron-sulfur binding subunit
MAEAPRSRLDLAEADEAHGVGRRDFLRGIGVTLVNSSALLAGCTRAPTEKIVPYRVQPADVKVGEASHYATAMSIDGYAVGLLVESHEGRPTKLEGNPEHPASLGAAGTYEQASLMDLYAPRRLRETLQRGTSATPVALQAALRNVANQNERGRGVHVVMPPTSSPSLLRTLTELRSRLPELSVHFFTPLSRANVWHGAISALGAVLEPRFDLSRAKVVLSLDADFLAHGPARLALAHDFAAGRRMLSHKDDMNRLYVVEAALSVTGQVADHRLATRDGDLPRVVAELLGTLGAELGASNPALAQLANGSGPADQQRSRFVRAVARDLAAHRGAALVLVGDRQPPALHAAAHALNAWLNSGEQVLSYAPSPIVAAGASEHDSLGELSAALGARAVEALIVLDVDLAESVPGHFASLLSAARTSFFFGTYAHATARHCEWAAPLVHWLESWGDARAFDGTVSIVQPLIEPLYTSRTPDEVLALLLGIAQPSAHERVREFWRARFANEFESEWQRSLQRGIVAESAIATVPRPELRWDWVSELSRLASRAAEPLELALYPDNRTLDGRFGENPWLVELPDPITKLTWQNAALLAPHTAARLGLTSGDVATLSAGNVSRSVPILTVPGQAENTVALSLGWGRADGLSTRGVNACAFQSSVVSFTGAVTLRSLGQREELPITQRHQGDEGFGESLFAVTTLAEYRRKPSFTEHRRKRQLSLYSAETPRAPQQWAMAIDLNACTGCSACVIACQAENNIPTVGPDGVKARREMHWLRIDRYVLPDASVVNQPMACQHCEHAPCEYVCPTGATVHSSDGLNQMVYNRCVGTRFCSNNCPYKVRRFNWFNYHADEQPPTSLARNPEVTVRARGVMEKCTYCVQRIRRAEIHARVGGGRIADGGVKTACEQACPTSAIVFGNLADKSSRVARLHQNQRAFEVLNELGTLPRTRYLAKLCNRNSEVT